MVTEKLQTIFGAADAPVLHKNAEYGFVIRSLKPESGAFRLLFTEGLSARPQPVDEKNQGHERIELYFLLPEYWDFSKKNWPVYWLNRIAQVPQKNNTWFGVGDTLPAGNPPENIDENLKCTYFILSEPMALHNQLNRNLLVDAGFQMLAVIPIFAKEFAFKTQNSHKALFQIFADKKIDETVDIFRQPVARKKFMGLF
ncbi:MAG: suppressor of fused domain protein [Bacteroidetes bacterium]|nr:suppressor of fused domain protein [Bacteroidota bacterium]